MPAAKWSLSVLCGFLAMLSIGVGEARSQTALLRVCNQSNVKASVAITAHPSAGNSNFVIKGWWTVDPGTCVNAQYVGWGWVYFYALAYSGADIEWRGSDVQLCVALPGPFERAVTASSTCDASILKSFTGYFIEAGTFTWTLN
jgi:uncharacterized membrane protein